MKKVAVEQGLTPVKQYLSAQGCQVIDAKTSDSKAQDAAVMVVNGCDKNLMGMQSVTQNIPIISADGLSPEEVYHRVQSYF
ncbi:YkuS family protein [Alicyclobacillus tolerans]|uniref:Phosphohistidine swiveling domain-containing protein n=2 Tax=Alicyclobacillus tolerans TaxID=90970 RepID=A0ABT9LYA3_9BACL|nr:MULTISPECIES: YkuS family protein [Alicyclobacillus]MDP9729252.1 phosphohistidine swiveling domain-containing protein [Alicyclobacillus tengchongensis]QRF22296.1 YkuS family protein [Alicyclobacillus sp. TC]SHK09910.1 Uncharacterised protein family (UPF0180) [Alicyclobacillus montanus]